MYDIAIIGAVPAGASAALFAAKAGKKTVMIDSDKTMTRRAMLWNYYGIQETVGPDLVVVGIQQATKYGADHVKGTVAGISVHAIITAANGANVAINILSEINR